MPDVCILTDSTVQFTRIDFPGRELVKIISFDVISAAHGKGPYLPPAQAMAGLPQGLSSPAYQDFLDQYILLGAKFREIMVLTLSASLGLTGCYAREAAVQYSGSAQVQVIDSQTTAMGLGLLVQLAAEAAASGASLAAIERLIRAAIHRVYTLFCIPGLAYLSGVGCLSPSQAIVGEMLGLLPIFVLEDGHLSLLSKVRTPRHLLESFQDFIEEFSDPFYIGLIKAASGGHFRTRLLRQHVKEHFSQVNLSECVINPHLAALIGPQSMGLVIMEH